MHLNSDLIFRKYALEYFKDCKRILEIGPTGFPSYYSEIVNSDKIEWNTLDISDACISGGEKNPLHHTSNDGYNYPFLENEFEIVLSGQVMEHVPRIWKWIKELERITKPGGKIIIISPISWPYHKAPDDCWRIYPEGMQALIEDFSSLKIILCHFESLEEFLFPDTKLIPGMSSAAYYNSTPYPEIQRRIKYNKIIKTLSKFKKGVRDFEIPIEISFDSICILEKPNINLH